jgi:hypothetical protein
MATKLIQIMGRGCGVKELEHCPPSYHFELTHAELSELILDPVGTGRRIGLAHPVRAVFVQPDLTPRDGDGGTRKYCCVSCLEDSVC